MKQGYNQLCWGCTALRGPPPTSEIAQHNALFTEVAEETAISLDMLGCVVICIEWHVNPGAHRHKDGLVSGKEKVHHQMLIFGGRQKPM